MHPSIRRQTIADALRRSALRLPAKTAIICGPTTWTYGEFDALVSRLAAGLATRGVETGDRVAVLARNSHGFAALRFALARLGAVLVPINFMLKADEVAYILRHAGAQTLATDSGLADLARAAAALDTKVKDFLWLPSEDPSEPAPGMTTFDELAACTAALPDVQLTSNDLAQIVYTSGTESTPKGAMLTHDAVLWQYVSCVVNAEIAEADLALHALPLYHCAQLDVFFGPAIYIGSTNVITAKPVPDNLLPQIAKHRITSFFAPPTVWIALLRSHRCSTPPIFPAWPRATTAPPSCRSKFCANWPPGCRMCGCGTFTARPRLRRSQPCWARMTSCASRVPPAGPF
jgi:fatty-acyl-CoA synthase